MKKIILVALLFLVNFVGATAQDLSPLTLNDLIVLGKYSDEQIRGALGTPIRYSAWDDEMGGGREYQYGPVTAYDMIRCTAMYGIESFTLESPRFSVLGGRLRVGNSLTKIYQLGFGRIESKGNGQYNCFIPDYFDPLIVTADGNGRIGVIRFSLSI